MNVQPLNRTLLLPSCSELGATVRSPHRTACGCSCVCGHCHDSLNSVAVSVVNNWGAAELLYLRRQSIAHAMFHVCSERSSVFAVASSSATPHPSCSQLRLPLSLLGPHVHAARLTKRTSGIAATRTGGPSPGSRSIGIEEEVVDAIAVLERPGAVPNTHFEQHDHGLQLLSQLQDLNSKMDTAVMEADTVLEQSEWDTLTLPVGARLLLLQWQLFSAVVCCWYSPVVHRGTRFEPLPQLLMSRVPALFHTLQLSQVPYRACPARHGMPRCLTKHSQQSNISVICHTPLIKSAQLDCSVSSTMSCCDDVLQPEVKEDFVRVYRDQRKEADRHKKEERRQRKALREQQRAARHAAQQQPQDPAPESPIWEQPLPAGQQQPSVLQPQQGPQQQPAVQSNPQVARPAASARQQPLRTPQQPLSQQLPQQPGLRTRRQRSSATALTAAATAASSSSSSSEAAPAPAARTTAAARNRQAPAAPASSAVPAAPAAPAAASTPSRTRAARSSVKTAAAAATAPDTSSTSSSSASSSLALPSALVPVSSGNTFAPLAGLPVVRSGGASTRRLQRAAGIGGRSSTATRAAAAAPTLGAKLSDNTMHGLVSVWCEGKEGGLASHAYRVAAP